MDTLTIRLAAKTRSKKTYEIGVNVLFDLSKITIENHDNTPGWRMYPSKNF